MILILKILFYFPSSQIQAIINITQCQEKIFFYILLTYISHLKKLFVIQIYNLHNLFAYLYFELKKKTILKKILLSIKKITKIIKNYLI